MLIAIDLFNEQNEFNEISEAYYYSALAECRLRNKSESLNLLDIALEKYDSLKAMSDPYCLIRK